jgi:hypothetical protein
MGVSLSIAYGITIMPVDISKCNDWSHCDVMHCSPSETHLRHNFRTPDKTATLLNDMPRSNGRPVTCLCRHGAPPRISFSKRNTAI